MITLSVDDQPEITGLMKKMLGRIDPRGRHMTAANMDEAFTLLSDEVQIIFLDIEMHGLNGIEAADLLAKKYPKLNIIFVTGHPEYSLSAHGVFPSGFLTKPVDEKDIRRALEHLRFPIEDKAAGLVVRCEPFAVFYNDQPLVFKSEITNELFAYLVHKNGALCTNGELLSVFWEGNPDKDGRLRQIVADIRTVLNDAGAGDVLIKKYGRIGLDTSAYSCVGNISSINVQFGWY